MACVTRSILGLCWPLLPGSRGEAQRNRRSGPARAGHAGLGGGSRDVARDPGGDGVLRLAIDAFIPGVAPFALLFPAVLVATLLAGWRCGLLTLGVIHLYAWYYLMPPDGFAVSPRDLQSLGLVFVAGLLTVLAAQGFRSASRAQVAEQTAKVAERDLLLRELDHRMRNNFQMVGALLTLQRGRATDPAAQAALGDAIARVHSIADAHRSLYATGDASTVDMGQYLTDLCRNLSEALALSELVRLECTVSPAPMSRDRAVGLIVNELVTNAVKHAFDAGAEGTIRVDFARTDHGYELLVADNGRGMPPEPARPQGRKGLGQGLVEAFARQARGTLRRGSGPGASFVLDLPE